MSESPDANDEIDELAASLSPITKEDLFAYREGRCDEVMRTRIDYHRDHLPNSPITEWFNEMDDKARNPERISLERIFLDDSKEGLDSAGI